MKQYILISALLCCGAVFSQTTIEEFNYADRGYRLLKENGMELRSDLRFEKVLEHELSGDDNYVVLKMMREDNSVAAIYFGYNSMHSHTIICDPRSDAEVLDKSRESSLLFVGAFYYPILNSIFPELIQRQFWPEYYD